jgi:transcription elongation factor GreB
MSKAFLRESDSEELPDLPRPAAILPPGAKNLLTPAGARRLREELDRLVARDRPPLAARSADDVEARHELQMLDQRIRLLQASLQSAEIVPPAAAPKEVVRFGDTVTTRENNGAEAQYQIVGVDETDFGKNAVSWQSPLARALLNARLGERVSFEAPGGRTTLEIVTID